MPAHLSVAVERGAALDHAPEHGLAEHGARHWPREVFRAHQTRLQVEAQRRCRLVTRCKRAQTRRWPASNDEPLRGHSTGNPWFAGCDIKPIQIQVMIREMLDHTERAGLECILLFDDGDYVSVNLYVYLWPSSRHGVLCAPAQNHWDHTHWNTSHRATRASYKTGLQ